MQTSIDDSDEMLQVKIETVSRRSLCIRRVSVWLQLTPDTGLFPIAECDTPWILLQNSFQQMLFSPNCPLFRIYCACLFFVQKQILIFRRLAKASSTLSLFSDTFEIRHNFKGFVMSSEVIVKKNENCDVEQLFVFLCVSVVINIYVDTRQPNAQPDDLSDVEIWILMFRSK